MKNFDLSPQTRLPVLPSLMCLGNSLLLAASLMILPSGLKAQSDDFNDGNDTGWTRYDPLGGLGAGAQATYTFPNRGYRIQATRFPAFPAAVGPARAGSVREDVSYTDFYVAVDVVDWDNSVRQAFGILARVNTPGLGQTTGYAFTYERGSGVTETSGDLDISRIDGEDPSGVSTGASAFHFEPDKDYRLVFIGKGPLLEGRIYELPDTITPKIVIRGSDSTYPSGSSGLVIYDNNGTAGAINPDATFDNFLALDVEPPRLTVEKLPFDEIQLSWPAEAAGFVLQGTPSLSTNPIVWTDITENIIEVGDQKVHVESSGIGNGFFRLKRP